MTHKGTAKGVFAFILAAAILLSFVAPMQRVHAVVDTFIDIVDLRYDTIMFTEDPTWENFGWMLVDGVCMAIPFVPSKGVKVLVNGGEVTYKTAKNVSKGSKITLKVAKSADDVAKGGVTLGTYGVLKKLSGSVGSHAHHFTGKVADKVSKYLGYKSSDEMLSILLAPELHSVITAKQAQEWAKLGNKYENVMNIIKVNWNVYAEFGRKVQVASIVDILSSPTGRKYFKNMVKSGDIIDKWIPAFNPVPEASYNPTILDSIIDWLLGATPVYAPSVPVDIQRSMWVDSITVNFNLDSFIADVNRNIKVPYAPLKIEDFSAIPITSESIVDVTNDYKNAPTVKLYSVEAKAYVCTEDGGKIHATSHNVGQYQIVWHKDNWLSFKSGSKYISVQGGDYLTIVDKPNGAEAWECFKVYSYQGNLYLLSQKNRKYVQVHTEESGTLQAARDQLDGLKDATWERFKIETVGTSTPAQSTTSAPAKAPPTTTAAPPQTAPSTTTAPHVTAPQYTASPVLPPPIDSGLINDGYVTEFGQDTNVYYDPAPADFAPPPPVPPEYSQNDYAFMYSQPSSWAWSQVTAAVANGLVTDEMTYDFQAATTRAEFCSAVIKFLDRWYSERLPNWADAAGTVYAFADTQDYNVCLARALGIVNGTDAERNLFSPNAALTREQAAVMLWNTLRYIGVLSRDYYDYGWADIWDVSNWAYRAANAMGNCGIMGGTSTGASVFSPRAAYTHEQSIVTFERLWEFAIAER